ncbi:hypothetical protein SCLCIDRAFT_33083 [Scleroderma citrinum Foug A]|uniref:Uncharacterized protein n=1 Tax=Scleroderma citrinum Foug A TaxID=1036808 RepID=A0A0C2YQ96_9AGAM|nr:hypothetical protein SCLCIDRAFT_33083 [Scleroderma citrinum Foug A]
MDTMVKNDTHEMHWELSEDNINNLLNFLFPDEVLFPKLKGELVQNKLEHYTMDQVLDYCIRYGLYVKGPPHASVSGSSKGKSKEKDMKVTSHWSGIPELDAKAPAAHETSLVLFFNSAIEAVNKASSTATVRTWTADSTMHPLNGGDAMRKPDLSCWLSTGSQFDWRHLASFAEVKNCGGKDNEKSSYIETAGKASCLLYAQDG